MCNYGLHMWWFKRIFIELVERVYNPLFTTLVIFLYDLGDSAFGDTREQVLAQIPALNCGDNIDQIDYDGEISNVLTDLPGVAGSFDELKMVVISLCDAEDDDISCTFQVQFILVTMWKSQ